MRYVRRVPKAIPEGLRLVHNFVPGTARLRARSPNLTPGPMGFTFYYERVNEPNVRRVICTCGWAPHLEHYNVEQD